MKANTQKLPLKPQMEYTLSCQLRAIHQIGKVKISDIIRDKKRFPGFSSFSSPTIYRHAKYPLDGNLKDFDKRHHNKGRPPLLTAHDKRSIIRQINILREQDGTFTSKKVQNNSVGKVVSNSTVRRVLSNAGYRYRVTRRKGLLTKNDVKKTFEVCTQSQTYEIRDQFLV